MTLWIAMKFWWPRLMPEKASHCVWSWPSLGHCGLGRLFSGSWGELAAVQWHREGYEHFFKEPGILFRNWGPPRFLHLMNRVPSYFVFWCCDKASPKETLGRMAYRAPRSRFQSIIVRKLKRQDLEAAGHITPTTKTRGAEDECTHTYQYSALLHFYRVWDPGRGVSNFILGLPISINVTKIIPINMCMSHFFPMPHVFVRCISCSQTPEAG